MKWLVTFLLLVNVAFFVHQYRQVSDAPPSPPRAMRPYDHVNRLLLMEEANVDKLRERKPAPKPALESAVEEPPQAPAPSAATSAIPSQNCYSIGPLTEDAQIAAMRSWLVAMGGDPALRVDERRELERYWVYLPPLDSREQAAKMVERMRAQGIEDVIPIFTGEMANAVSVGVFSRRSSLERRLQQLRALGYEPSIAPRYSAESTWWLDVTFEEGGRLTQNELAARFPDVQLSEASCVSGEIARDGPDS